MNTELMRLCYAMLGWLARTTHFPFRQTTHEELLQFGPPSPFPPPSTRAVKYDDVLPLLPFAVVCSAPLSSSCLPWLAYRILGKVERRTFSYEILLWSRFLPSSAPTLLYYCEEYRGSSSSSRAGNKSDRRQWWQGKSERTNDRGVELDDDDDGCLIRVELRTTLHYSCVMPGMAFVLFPPTVRSFVVSFVLHLGRSVGVCTGSPRRNAPREYGEC